MFHIKKLFRFILVALPIISFSQTSYLRSGKEQWLLDRLEIKQQTNNDFNLGTVKPYSRAVYVREGKKIDSNLALGKNAESLTGVDKYNLDRFLANNSEFASTQKNSWKSTKPWSNNFYPTKGNFLEVNEKDFYMAVNPVINQQQYVESGTSQRIFLNSKGVTARGMISKKIGFDFYLTDNQERGPSYEQNFLGNYFKAVPGNGFFKAFKSDATAADYFDARGSVTWNVAKHIDMQFGYDKNFIGNGYRSLFLSDFSSNYLFLKFNTRIWKINYTNLFMELQPEFRGSDQLLPHKYATMHHFSINATPWLNVGAFESVIFGRVNHFEFSYLLPVIFLRSIEGENGSPDNANIGFDFKANIAKKFQFYGQLMLDEFILSKIKNDPTNWVNKQAFQLGAKYVDAFGINNLDLQLEYNSVRPFTYQHSDSVANYTHYNQPLAHPLGANFNEIIAIAKYQPINKLFCTGKIIYYNQGLDSAGLNFGSSPFESYNRIDQMGTRPNRDNGFSIGSGRSNKVLNLSLGASYEIKENLFIDGSATIRAAKLGGTTNNSTIIGVGLRWNIGRREYDY